VVFYRSFSSQWIDFCHVINRFVVFYAHAPHPGPPTTDAFFILFLERDRAAKIHVEVEYKNQSHIT
jgi:hypothetical protein